MTEISLSHTVLSQITDAIPDEAEDQSTLVQSMIEEIATRAEVFINRFARSYFLYTEPVHEFVGLKSRDERGLTNHEVRYRMIIHDTHVSVFTQAEIPLDEMYDVRTIIAESQLPEFAEK